MIITHAKTIAPHVWSSKQLGYYVGSIHRAHEQVKPQKKIKWMSFKASYSTITDLYDDGLSIGSLFTKLCFQSRSIN